MKPIVSLFLLVCFIAYHFGYHIFYLAYQAKIEKEWTERVYQEDFLDKKILKIPMKLPYSFDEHSFQLANIPFTKDGKAYRAIQKRFRDDTFELVYVPDMAKINLELKTKTWILSLIPENSSGTQKGQIISQTSFKDYIKPIFRFVFLSSPACSANWRTFFSCSYEELFLSAPYPPPRLA